MARLTAVSKLGEMSLGLRLCQNWERYGSIAAMPNWKRRGSTYSFPESGRDVAGPTAMPKLEEI
jgi:hypothetical protein